MALQQTGTIKGLATDLAGKKVAGVARLTVGILSGAAHWRDSH